MSYSKVKSLRPCSSSTLDRESPSAKKPSIPNSTNDSTKYPVPIANHNIHRKDPFYRKKSDGSVSDASTHSSLAGGKLTEAPGRLTPTCPGRMKAPPVCKDLALKRVASTMQDIRCFSPEEAELCAQKCLVAAGWNHGTNVEKVPFNIEKPAPEVVAPVEGKPSISSSSTVVTNSSASVGVVGVAQTSSVRGCAPNDPPLKVVRTDDCVLNSEDETGAVVGEKTKKIMPSPPPSPKHLSSSFTEKLIKDAQSRQGRSLQRWLVHSQTESLVREVAGTIPITKDGRIVLVSASRKKEWILPKGGWDSDETKEECAIRETYEEGGLLGKLGACLAPIDYESGKSKKRRFDSTNSSDMKGLPPVAKKAKSELKESNEAQSILSPESPKLSFIRLLLFPLYLTEVKSEWPEKGRLRKLVDIDEAIRIMEKEDRLYFKRGLEIVKEKGLHLVHQTDGQSN